MAEQDPMARKPQTGLPDVFAKPGQAPQRNTAIEDLPKSAAPAAPTPAAPAPAAPAPAAPAAAASAAAASAAAAPAAAAPAPAAVAKPASPLRPAQPPLPPKPTPPPSASLRPPARPAAPPRSAAQKVTLLACAAVLVALAAPVVEDDLLGRFGIATPAFTAQREAALMLSRQEQKLRDLEQRLNEAVAQLTATSVEMQQSAMRSTDGAAWGRLLSLGRVADALRGPTPFAYDLAIAQSVGAGINEFQADLGKLSAYANTGVPTFADLNREFRRIADEALRPGRGILPGGLVRRLTELNQWTSSSSPPADPTPELVQGATARLNEGDLAAAIVVVRQISGAYQGAFAGWLKDAQARVSADALVRRIDRSVAALARELPR